jgi:hypothetical protein
MQDFSWRPLLKYYGHSGIETARLPKWLFYICNKLRSLVFGITIKVQRIFYKR